MQREFSQIKIQTTIAPKDVDIDCKLTIYSNFFTNELENYSDTYIDNCSSPVCEASASNLDQLIEDFADICISRVSDNLEFLDNCRDYHLFENKVEPSLQRLEQRMVSTFKSMRIAMAEDKTSIILDLVVLLNDCRGRMSEISLSTNNLHISKFGTFGTMGRFRFQYCVDSLRTLFGHPYYQSTSMNSDELPAAEDVV